MSTEKVIIDDQMDCVEVETKPLTLFTHRGDVRLGYPERTEISPDKTIVAKAENETEDRLGRWFVMQILESEHTAGWTPSTLPEKHVYGMGVLMIRAFQSGGKPPALILPESFLHPAQQLLLADVLIQLVTAAKHQRAKE